MARQDRHIQSIVVLNLELNSNAKQIQLRFQHERTKTWTAQWLLGPSAHHTATMQTSTPKVFSFASSRTTQKFRIPVGARHFALACTGRAVNWPTWPVLRCHTSSVSVGRFPRQQAQRTSSNLSASASMQTQVQTQVHSAMLGLTQEKFNTGIFWL